MTNTNDIETCLVCDKPVYSRGLCAKHHNDFHREKKKVPQEHQEGFEKELIEKGLLLPRQPPGKKAKEPLVFREIAAKYSKPIQQEIDEASEKVGESVERAKAKRTKKTKSENTPKKKAN